MEHLGWWLAATGWAGTTVYYRWYIRSLRRDLDMYVAEYGTLSDKYIKLLKIAGRLWAARRFAQTKPRWADAGRAYSRHMLRAAAVRHSRAVDWPVVLPDATAAPQEA